MKLVVVLLNGEEKTYFCNGCSWDETKDVLGLYKASGEKYATICLGQIAYWYLED